MIITEECIIPVNQSSEVGEPESSEVGEPESSEVGEPESSEVGEPESYEIFVTSLEAFEGIVAQVM